MLSNSGETDELVAADAAPQAPGRAARRASPATTTVSLAQAADVHLDAAVDAEACPLGLAPTASTTAALALGDALALALLDARGFSAEDFARSHPGGALGRQLLTRVADVMRDGRRAAGRPRRRDAGRGDRRDEPQGHGHDGGRRRRRRVAGVFTDGDLRRCLDRMRDIGAASSRRRHDAARRARSTADRLAIDCVEAMETAPKVSQLLVVDARGALVGALHMHDLFRARVV